MGLFSWFQRAKQWNAEHRVAWEGMSNSRAGQLSRFQERARAALEAACRHRGLPAADYELTLAGKAEPYLTGAFSDGRRYWIYTDGAGIEAQRLEEWDFRTPDELIAAFLAGLPQGSGEHAT